MNAMNASKKSNNAPAAPATQTIAPVIRVRSPAAGNDPAPAQATYRDEVEAWAHHAAAANGFGDSKAIMLLHPAWSSSYDLHHIARIRRAAVIGAKLATVFDALRLLARRAYARYRQYREARAIFDTLRQLDDRTLRDIGMARDEIQSVAAEMTGLAEHTRIRVRPIGVPDMTDA